MLSDAREININYVQRHDFKSILHTEKVYHNIKSGNDLDVNFYKILEDLSKKIRRYQEQKCKSTSRIGVLWIQYMEMEDILNNYSTSLFDPTRLKRHAKKNHLADAVCKQVEQEQETALAVSIYVLYGGSILH